MPGLPPAGVQNLVMQARQGNQGAAQTLAEMGYAPNGAPLQGGMPPMGGAAPMQGAPPMGGAMPPGGGNAPQGMPPGGAPPMSQADFSGYGRPPPPPDQQARQAAMLQQILRQRAMQGQ